jgi:hypothetical protein
MGASTVFEEMPKARMSCFCQESNRSRPACSQSIHRLQYLMLHSHIFRHFQVAAVQEVSSQNFCMISCDCVFNVNYIP